MPYLRNGRRRSNYDPARAEKEGPGRDEAIAFYRYLGATVTDNDKDKDGNVDFSKGDLLATFPNGNVVVVEAAAKGSDLWKWITDGVDVEERKLKYVHQLGAEKTFLFMASSDSKQALLIPYTCLCAAEEDCGEEFAGHRLIRSSANFVMPEHGCHRIVKNCKTEDGGWEKNDFYRIPYQYVTHILIKESGRKYDFIQKWVPFNRS